VRSSTGGRGPRHRPVIIQPAPCGAIAICFALPDSGTCLSCRIFGTSATACRYTGGLVDIVVSVKSIYPDELAADFSLTGLPYGLIASRAIPDEVFLRIPSRWAPALLLLLPFSMAACAGQLLSRCTWAAQCNSDQS
jgi:hypothetical protein